MDNDEGRGSCLAIDPLLQQLGTLGLTYLGAYVDDLSFGAR